MHKFYYPLFVIFLLILGNTAFAQKQAGYVITHKNDTIRCEVWRTTFGNGAKYKLSEKGKTIKINTDSIKEYEVREDTSRYRAVALKHGKDPIFLPMLEEGRICVYEEVQTNYNPNGMSTSTTNWYVSKDNGDPVMMKTSGLNLFGADHDERKSALGNMFSDEPKVAAEYKAENSFSFKKIRKFIEEYNQNDTVSKGERYSSNF